MELNIILNHNFVNIFIEYEKFAYKKFNCCKKDY